MRHTSLKSPVRDLTLAFVALLLAAGPANAAFEVDHYDLGAGSESLKVAVITDLHGDVTKLTTAVGVLNGIDSVSPLSAVLVTGDLVNWLDTTNMGLLSGITGQLRNLPCPWVPMIGNHDRQFNGPLEGAEWADGTGVQGMFATRGFHRWMDTTFRRLDSLYSDPNGNGPIADFRRYRKLPNNFQIRNWPESYNFDGQSRDAFEQSSFRAGPPGSPYRFLCLDFNSRSWQDTVTIPILFGLFNIVFPGGPSPAGEVLSLPFADSATSLYIRDSSPSAAASCTLYTGVSYTGAAYPFVLDAGHTSGCFDLNGICDSMVKSVKLGSNCDTVWLFSGTPWSSTGFVLDSSDADLARNGPVEWWLNELHAYDSTFDLKVKDKLIIFAHNMPSVLPVLDDFYEFGGRLNPEYESLYSLMHPYKNRIGAWFAGHITPEGFLGQPGRTGQWADMCPRFLCYNNNDADGHATIMTLRWHLADYRFAEVLAGASGVFPNPLDATTEDSAIYAIRMNPDASGTDIDASGTLCKGQATLRRMVDHVMLGAPDSAVVPWDCRDSVGRLVLPGDDYNARFFAGSVPEGVSYFAVKGLTLTGSVSGVLDSAANPVVLTGNVTVPDGETLRIEPGVRIMPAGNFGITVHGTLIGAGLPGDTGRILFTPYRRMVPVPESVPDSMYWKGIKVEPDGRCSLNNCVIEYAGGTPGQDSAALFWKDAGSVVITNSVIRHSSTRGVCADDASDLPAVLVGDTFEYCVSYPVAAIAESVHSIVHSNTFRNNTLKGMDVRLLSPGGTLTVNSEWTKCESTAWRYDVSGYGDLEVCPESAGVCTLRVAPGVTMRFGDGKALVVGHETDKYGRLIADASAGPIVFTGMDTTTAGNYWSGVNFQGHSSGYMDSCFVSHSDGDGVHIGTNANVSLRHCTLRKASDCGLEIAGAPATLYRCTFADNAVGAHSEREATGVAFNSCTFSGNSNFGLRLKDFDEASVTGCSFAGNDKPVRLRANLVSALVANNTFSGNTFKGVVIGDGTGNSAITSGTHTWSASPEMYVYRCSTDVSVEGSSKDAGGETDALGAGTDGNARPGAAGNSGFGQAGGSKPAARDVTPTLVLSPGAVVQLRENKLLKIDHAVLTARGQPGTPVTFDNYVSGEFWNSVRLDHADGSELEYCTFDSGGYDGAGLPAVEGAVYCFYTDALIRRCTFTNACRRDTSVGLQVKYCAPTIRQCRFDNCGRGVGINDADGCLHVDSCEFEQCREGIYVEKDAPSRSSRCNFIDNTYAGVNNTSDADSVGRANYCYWSNPVHPHGPHGGDTVYNTTWTNALENPVELMPTLDVSVLALLAPVGRYYQTDTAATPNGVLVNAFDDSVSASVRMRILRTAPDSVVYDTSKIVKLAAFDTAGVGFPACTLSTGVYQVRFTCFVNGDSNQSNDTIIDTVTVRPYTDAAALAMLTPPAAVSIEDTITPSVSIANLGTTTQSVPVRFYIDNQLEETDTVEITPYETTAVGFPARMLGAGTYDFKFKTCLALDDSTANDSLVQSVWVKNGDYWHTLAVPDFGEARLCWDGGNYVYAAERGSSTMKRYDVAADTWTSITSPPAGSMTCIRGLACHQGEIYVIGGTSYDAGSGLSTQGTLGKSGGRDATACLMRYVPSGNTWTMVRSGLTVNGSGDDVALVSDRGGSIYINPGGPGRGIVRYMLAEDSVVSVSAPAVLDFHGAADWSTKYLYALAGIDTLYRYDRLAGAVGWSKLANPAGMSGQASYGSTIACDPVANRLYAFAPRGPSGALSAGNGKGRDATHEYYLWDRRNDDSVWTQRTGPLTVSDGAGMCFGALDAYLLDDNGAGLVFRRYRPWPLQDAAAIGVYGPDSVSAESVFTMYGIVQNADSVARQIPVELVIGSYADTLTPTLGPRTRDTVAFSSVELHSTGVETVRLRVMPAYTDARHGNDTAWSSVFVTVALDVSADSITSPRGDWPYDSLVRPSGWVHNHGDETLAVHVAFTAGTSYTDSFWLAVPPFTSVRADSFDTCRLWAGNNVLKLQALCAGDLVPENDSVLDTVDMITGEYWKLAAPAPGSSALEIGGSGNVIYAVPDAGNWLSRYSATSDTWVNLSNSSLTTAYSMAVRGSKVYVLGATTTDQGKGGTLGNGHDATTYKIVKYDSTAGTWATLVSGLPTGVSAGSCIFVVNDTSLFLLGAGPINPFQRYSFSAHTWTARKAAPGSASHSYTSGVGCDGNCYIMNDQAGRLFRYQPATNAWDTLASINAPALPTATALTATSDGKFYLYWKATQQPTGGTGFYEYSGGITGSWTTKPAFWNAAVNPALGAAAGRPWLSQGDTSKTFACYKAAAVLDVAADKVIAPDTVRCDTTVAVQGVVENLSAVPVWCSAQLEVPGDSTQVSAEYYLVAGQKDTVTFDPCSIAAGLQTLTLTAVCTGDAVSGNNVSTAQVQVEAPWEPRTDNFTQGRLDADADSSVFAANRNAHQVSRYTVNTDHWSALPTPPLDSGIIDVSYWHDTLYILGPVYAKTMLSGEGKLSSQDSPTGWAIYRLPLGATSWTLVTNTMPTGANPTENSWIVAKDSSIYYEPGYGNRFFRHNSAGWTELASLPDSIEPPCALDWNRADNIYLLATVGDSTRFYGYSIAGNDWDVLPSVPRATGYGMGLAAAPDSGDVLALLPHNSTEAYLYGYDPTSQDWTALTPAPWELVSGGAFTYHNGADYALTGHSSDSLSAFWCYDPSFQMQQFQRKDGVAGGHVALSRTWLYPCVPNPFTGSTTLHWQLPAKGRATVTVHDATGRLVRTICDCEQEPGDHTAVWDGKDGHGRSLGGGVYFCTLETGGSRLGRKVVLSQNR